MIFKKGSIQLLQTQIILCFLLTIDFGTSFFNLTNNGKNKYFR